MASEHHTSNNGNGESHGRHVAPKTSRRLGRDILSRARSWLSTDIGDIGRSRTDASIFERSLRLLAVTTLAGTLAGCNTSGERAPTPEFKDKNPDVAAQRLSKQTTELTATMSGAAELRTTFLELGRLDVMDTLERGQVNLDTVSPSHFDVSASGQTVTSDIVMDGNQANFVLRTQTSETSTRLIVGGITPDSYRNHGTNGTDGDLDPKATAGALTVESGIHRLTDETRAISYGNSPAGDEAHMTSVVFGGTHGESTKLYVINGAGEALPAASAKQTVLSLAGSDPGGLSMFEQEAA